MRYDAVPIIDNYQDRKCGQYVKVANQRKKILRKCIKNETKFVLKPPPTP